MDSDDEIFMSIPLDVPTDLRRSNTKTINSNGPSLTSSQGSWVDSAFDGFDIPPAGINNGLKSRANKPASRPKTTKRPNESEPFITSSGKSKKAPCSKVNNELWAEKHSPACEEDLAVHKKKVAEIKDCLNYAFSNKKNRAPMVLLTGPSGAGKTATLQVLCKDLKVDLQEWSNPTGETFHSLKDSDDSWQDRTNYYGGQSQASVFQDFLLRTSKYKTLEIFACNSFQRRAILIEDFPNAFYRDASQFHSILRHFKQSGHCPLIFIISDSTSGESLERKLFPKDFQEELAIANISFNPVAQTSLVKVLTRISSLEASSSSGVRLRVPDKSTLNALATASAGDLRGAINALQFACLKDTKDLSQCLNKTHATSTNKKNSKYKAQKAQKTGLSRLQKKSSDISPEDRISDLSAIGGRDTSLFLFRALGKILYCKRGDPVDFPDHESLPDHLQQYYRDPLLVDPEDVVDKCQLSSDFFVAYLHQNYLEFYPELEDIVSASHYLSDVDYLTVNWATRSSLTAYSSSVAARSIMFCNSSRARCTGNAKSGLGWKPLHKPQLFTVSKDAKKNALRAKELFKGQCWTPIEMQTNLIPFAAMIKPTSTKPGQDYFLKSIGRINKWNKTVREEKLDEKDVEVDSAESLSVQLVEKQNTEDEDLNVEDEEIEIEEFSD